MFFSRIFSPAVYGMMLMTLAMQIVPFSDAFAKLLTAEYGTPLLQTAWARIVFAALFLLPAGMSAFPRAFSAGRRLWKPYFLRGACWAGATVFFFAALKDNPLPSALALLFVAPLFVAACAPMLLGESFSLRGLAASGAGFCGVLLVLRPGAETFSPSLLWALAAGICYGGYLMAARRGGGLGGGGATFITMIAAAILVAPFALWQWRAPSGAEFALMAAMGGLSAAGHFLITKACEYAGASQVAPFNYTEIVGASAASYWFFSELPAPQVYAGVAIIAAAGIYVAAADLRDSRARKPQI